MHGRWEILGCHLIPHINKNRYKDFQISIRVCLFNYSNNQLIDILLENKEIKSIIQGEPHQHPEAPFEMLNAIELAKSNQEILEATKYLEASAILRHD